MSAISKLSNSVLVFKNGSSGAMVAAYLHTMGLNPFYVGRKNQSLDLETSVSAWGKVVILKVETIADIDISSIRLVFITVSAHDLSGVLKRFVSGLSKNCVVIVVCKGCVDRVVKQYAKLYPHLQWRLGVSTLYNKHPHRSLNMIDQQSGHLYWGAVPTVIDSRVQNQKLQLTAIENELIAQDFHKLFSIESQIVERYCRKWIFDVTIESLCVARNLPKLGLLLDDIKELKEVFFESLKLSEQLWGSWCGKYDKIFDELLVHIAKSFEVPSELWLTSQMGQKIKWDYLIGQAAHYRGYELLKTYIKRLESRNNTVG